MRPLNLNNVLPQYEGASAHMPAGAYPCVITKVTDVPEKEYLDVVVDVSAGDWKGEFSRSFYDGKDWAHHFILSYKESAQGFLKGRLQAITESNPGFDAEAALFAGKEQMLLGKAVGAVFACEEYWDNAAGEFKVGANVRPQRMVKLADVEEENKTPTEPVMLSRNGKVKALTRAGFSQYEAEGIADGLGKPAQAAAAQDAGEAYGDIPF